MNQKTSKKNTRNLLCILLLIGSALAALKCIFIGYQMDEGYAITLSCRMLNGDKMITHIWDPHQTSAFVSEFLILIYRSLFHTTAGVAIWLRIWGTLIHGGLSFGVFRVMSRFLSREHSFYLALLYFNLLPKGYVTPEFSNLLIWFLTLLLLDLFHLEQTKKPATALRCGLWMCGMVLSYPSAAILFPFFLWYLWKQHGYGKKSALLFTGTCLISGALYLARLLGYMTLTELSDNLHYMMLGNSGHTEITLLQKFGEYFIQCGQALLISAFCGAAAWLYMKFRRQITEKRRENFALFMFYTLIIVTVFPLIIWLLTPKNNDYFYIHTAYFTLFVFFYIFGNNIAENKTAEKNNTIKLWMFSSVLTFIAVLLLTDLTVFTSVRYLLPGIVMGTAAALLYTKRHAPDVYQKYGMAFLLISCFAAVFTKGWEYRGDQDLPQNVTRVRGIISEGPAKGILAEYMQCVMHESLHAEMQEFMEPGDKVFLLENDATGYLFRDDIEIASYTTISDPRYDDTLLKYWELYPEKYPDIMVIPCWYGEIHWDNETWIIQWVEHEYGASQIIDGTYFRYYIKK